jgi:Holliday junction resolvase
MVLKGKQKGREFEAKVRKILTENNWFVYTKGVSTPGPDILAIKNCFAVVLELKTFQRKSKRELKNIVDLLSTNLENYKKFLQRAGFKKTVLGVLIEIREEKRIYYFENGDKEIKIFNTLKDFVNYLNSENILNFLGQSDREDR